MAKIIVCSEIQEEGIQKLREAGHELFIDSGISSQELLEKIDEYDAMIIRSKPKVTREVLDAAGHLKAIARAGVGLDNVDLEYAKERGVEIFNSSEAPCNAVAELALGLMFSLARYIPEADSCLKNGKWEHRALPGSELNGKILGVIGFGRIGYSLAEKAKALGMNVLAYDYAFELVKPKAAEIGVKVVDLDLLYAESDYISIHVPLLPNTLHMIDREVFTKMKTGVKIINTARGGIIDEFALRWALDTGKVAGAALDVFEEEPSPKEELVTCSNIICTPHIGAGSEEAQTGNSVIVAEKLIGFFNS